MSARNRLLWILGLAYVALVVGVVTAPFAFIQGQVLVGIIAVIETAAATVALTWAGYTLAMSDA